MKEPVIFQCSRGPFIKILNILLSFFFEINIEFELIQSLKEINEAIIGVFKYFLIVGEICFDKKSHPLPIQNIIYANLLFVMNFFYTNYFLSNNSEIKKIIKDSIINLSTFLILLYKIEIFNNNNIDDNYGNKNCFVLELFETYLLNIKNEEIITKKFLKNMEVFLIY